VAPGFPLSGNGWKYYGLLADLCNHGLQRKPENGRAIADSADGEKLSQS
jgi:hypothetical protein